jgi:hypothetical protein
VPTLVLKYTSYEPLATLLLWVATPFGVTILSSPAVKKLRPYES